MIKGNPVIKADPSVIIKQEASTEAANIATSSKAQRRSLFPRNSIAGQKHVIDLTASDGEDEDENNEQTSGPVQLSSSSQSGSSPATSSPRYVLLFLLPGVQQRWWSGTEGEKRIH